MLLLTLQAALSQTLLSCNEIKEAYQISSCCDSTDPDTHATCLATAQQINITRDTVVSDFAIYGQRMNITSETHFANDALTGRVMESPNIGSGIIFHKDSGSMTAEYANVRTLYSGNGIQLGRTSIVADKTTQNGVMKHDTGLEMNALRVKGAQTTDRTQGLKCDQAFTREFTNSDFLIQPGAEILIDSALYLQKASGEIVDITDGEPRVSQPTEIASIGKAVGAYTTEILMHYIRESCNGTCANSILNTVNGASSLYEIFGNTITYNEETFKHFTAHDLVDHTIGITDYHFLQPHSKPLRTAKGTPFYDARSHFSPEFVLPDVNVASVDVFEYNRADAFVIDRDVFYGLNDQMSLIKSHALVEVWAKVSVTEESNVPATGEMIRLTGVHDSIDGTYISYSGLVPGLNVSGTGSFYVYIGSKEPRMATTIDGVLYNNYELSPLLDCDLEANGTEFVSTCDDAVHSVPLGSLQISNAASMTISSMSLGAPIISVNSMMKRNKYIAHPQSEQIKQRLSEGKASDQIVKHWALLDTGGADLFSTAKMISVHTLLQRPGVMGRAMKYTLKYGTQKYPMRTTRTYYATTSSVHSEGFMEMLAELIESTHDPMQLRGTTAKKITDELFFKKVEIGYTSSGERSYCPHGTTEAPLFACYSKIDSRDYAKVLKLFHNDGKYKVDPDGKFLSIGGTSETDNVHQLASTSHLFQRLPEPSGNKKYVFTSDAWIDATWICDTPSHCPLGRPPRKGEDYIEVWPQDYFDYNMANGLIAEKYVFVNDVWATSTWICDTDPSYCPLGRPPVAGDVYFGQWPQDWFDSNLASGNLRLGFIPEINILDAQNPQFEFRAKQLPSYNATTGMVPLADFEEAYDRGIPMHGTNIQSSSATGVSAFQLTWGSASGKEMVLATLKDGTKLGGMVAVHNVGVTGVPWDRDIRPYSRNDITATSEEIERRLDFQEGNNKFTERSSPFSFVFEAFASDLSLPTPTYPIQPEPDCFEVSTDGRCGYGGWGWKACGPTTYPDFPWEPTHDRLCCSSVNWCGWDGTDGDPWCTDTGLGFYPDLTYIANVSNPKICNQEQYAGFNTNPGR